MWIRAYKSCENSIGRNICWDWGPDWLLNILNKILMAPNLLLFIRCLFGFKGFFRYPNILIFKNWKSQSILNSLCYWINSVFHLIRSMSYRWISKLIWFWMLVDWGRNLRLGWCNLRSRLCFYFTFASTEDLSIYYSIGKMIGFTLFTKVVIKHVL